MYMHNTTTTTTTTTHHCDECWARDREQGQCTPPHLEVDAELEKEDTRRPRIKTPPSKQGRDILLCTPPTLASLRMRNC